MTKKQINKYKELNNKDYKSLTGNERIMLETLKKMFQAKEKFNKNNNNKKIKIEMKKSSSSITEEEYQRNLKACRKQAKKLSSDRIIEDIKNKRDKALR